MVPIYLYFIMLLPEDEYGNTKALCSYLEGVVAGSSGCPCLFYAHTDMMKSLISSWYEM